MRIPNICLVLKLDNGKVVSIANEQNHRVTEPSSTVLVYRFGQESGSKPSGNASK